jgi:tRNA 5-methylaminomethyl-2-thiouridine biosynthesis bifunctional protein
MGDQPDIEWRDGAPRSRRFDDIYYSPGEGAAKSEAVFLDGCDLPSRWRDREQFVIAETGFGTGLNFLVTWRAWREHRQRGQRLHFVSLEGFPLGVDALLRTARQWPELEPLGRRLAECYPPVTPGFHRLCFAEDGVFLTLLIGDVAQVLPQLEARVDAWFLDGFAPAKNPQMWQPELFAEMARLSRTGATMATFTAAGFVRRGLEARGFEMRRTPGFGHKRERLVGQFAGPTATSSRPSWCPPDSPQPPASVAVIGGGLAARCLQHALDERGIGTLLVGPDEPSASDNPLANVMPRLPADRSPVGRLNWSAFLNACQYWSKSDRFEPVGALLLATSKDEQARQQSLLESWRCSDQVEAVDAERASELAAVKLPHGGIWYPTAGLVTGPVLARADRDRRRVTDLQPFQDRWRLQLDDGEQLGPFDAVVVAAGPGSRALLPRAYLQLMGFAGQASFLDASADTRALKCTLMAGRYFTPEKSGRHVLGATFDAADMEHTPAIAELDHQRNLEALSAALPGLSLGSVTGGWAGVRVTTADRLPVAGPVVELEDFCQRFAELRKRRLKGPGPVADIGGLHVLSGLGSRSFSHARLGAELVMARMLGEPWPLERNLALLLDPARFLVRDLKRGKI